MVEIEDRGITYKSWQSYAKALKYELSSLQSLCHNQSAVPLAHLSVRKAIRRNKLRGVLENYMKEES